MEQREIVTEKNLVPRNGWTPLLVILAMILGAIALLVT